MTARVWEEMTPKGSTGIRSKSTQAPRAETLNVRVKLEERGLNAAKAAQGAQALLDVVAWVKAGGVPIATNAWIQELGIPGANAQPIVHEMDGRVHTHQLVRLKRATRPQQREAGEQAIARIEVENEQETRWTHSIEDNEGWDNATERLAKALAKLAGNEAVGRGLCAGIALNIPLASAEVLCKACPGAVPPPDNNGLAQALRQGAGPRLIERLLEGGADPEHTDEQGRNAWHQAAAARSTSNNEPSVAVLHQHWKKRRNEAARWGTETHPAARRDGSGACALARCPAQRLRMWRAIIGAQTLPWAQRLRASADDATQLRKTLEAMHSQQEQGRWVGTLATLSRREAHELVRAQNTIVAWLNETLETSEDKVCQAVVRQLASTAHGAGWLDAAMDQCQNSGHGAARALGAYPARLEACARLAAEASNAPTARRWIERWRAIDNVEAQTRAGSALLAFAIERCDEALALSCVEDGIQVVAEGTVLRNLTRWKTIPEKVLHAIDAAGTANAWNTTDAQRWIAPARVHARDAEPVATAITRRHWRAALALTAATARSTGAQERRRIRRVRAFAIESGVEEAITILRKTQTLAGDPAQELARAIRAGAVKTAAWLIAEIDNEEQGQQLRRAFTIHAAPCATMEPEMAQTLLEAVPIDHRAGCARTMMNDGKIGWMGGTRRHRYHQVLINAGAALDPAVEAELTRRMGGTRGWRVAPAGAGARSWCVLYPASTVLTDGDTIWQQGRDAAKKNLEECLSTDPTRRSKAAAGIGRAMVEAQGGNSTHCIDIECVREDGRHGTKLAQILSEALWNAQKQSAEADRLGAGPTR